MLDEKEKESVQISKLKWKGKNVQFSALNVSIFI